jgi:hypothetical protein
MLTSLRVSGFIMKWNELLCSMRSISEDTNPQWQHLDIALEIMAEKGWTVVDGLYKCMALPFRISWYNTAVVHISDNKSNSFKFFLKS